MGFEDGKSKIHEQEEMKKEIVVQRERVENAVYLQGQVKA